MSFMTEEPFALDRGHVESGVRPRLSVSTVFADHLDTGISQKQQDLREGILDSHLWNQPGVEKALSHRPVVLMGIDGGSLDLSPESQWILLPTSPSELNPQGNFVFNVLGEDPDVYKKFQADNSGLAEALRQRTEGDFARSNTDRNMDTRAASSLLYPALPVATAIALSTPRGQAAIRTLLEKPMSRRRVLKLLGGGFTALAVPQTLISGADWGRSIIAYQAAHAQPGPLSNILEDTAGLLRSRVDQSDYNQARMAKLIAATEDASGLVAQFYPGIEGSAIALAGHSHLYDRTVDMVGNQELRAQALRRYTNQLFAVVDEYAQGDASIDTDGAKRRIADHTATMIINRIEEPEVSEGTTTAIEKIQKATTRVGEFKSQSVVAALSPLTSSLRQGQV